MMTISIQHPHEAGTPEKPASRSRKNQPQDSPRKREVTDPREMRSDRSDHRDWWSTVARANAQRDQGEGGGREETNSQDKQAAGTKRRRQDGGSGGVDKGNKISNFFRVRLSE